MLISLESLGSWELRVYIVKWVFDGRNNGIGDRLLKDSCGAELFMNSGDNELLNNSQGDELLLNSGDNELLIGSNGDRSLINSKYDELTLGFRIK